MSEQIYMDDITAICLELAEQLQHKFNLSDSEANSLYCKISDMLADFTNYPEYRHYN